MLAQFSTIHLQWARFGRFAGFGLGKRRGHGGVKRDAAFDLFYGLMDMAVENCHRAEAFEITQSLRAIFRAPAPLWIYFPQRDVGKDHDGRVTRATFQVVFEPFQLLLTERAEAVLLDVHDVDNPNEMDTAMVKAIPTVTLRIFSETFEIQFAIVARDIMLAGHEENLRGLRALQQVVQRVEFLRR